jgi:hypothetical protein
MIYPLIPTGKSTTRPLYLPENRRPAPYTYRKIDDPPPIPTGFILSNNKIIVIIMLPAPYTYRKTPLPAPYTYLLAEVRRQHSSSRLSIFSKLFALVCSFHVATKIRG